MNFSLVINHTPWVPERVRAKQEMLLELLPLSRGVPFFLHETDYRGRDWQQDGKVAWALAQWQWSVQQEATHHVFMTDDLHLAPRFWDCLYAMVDACPDRPIGLLSNHPKAVELASDGYRWYATNSWIVGPAYVLPHASLQRFLEWFEALPKGDWREHGTQAYRNDDSSLNEWVTNGGGGGRTLHPLPTIIEHREDVVSTVGHGDRFSRERLSWRWARAVLDTPEGDFRWTSVPRNFADAPIELSEFWNQRGGPSEAPMLAVGA